MAIYTWPCLHVCCRPGKGMNDGEGEKVIRQGGNCHFISQMIEKEGGKETRIKAGGEEGGQ